MRITTAFFVGVLVAAIGVLIIWSNPKRRVNRAAFLCSSNIALWLLSLHIAFTTVDGVFWVRVACAVAAWVPFQFLLVKDSISSDVRLRETVRKSWLMLVIAAALAVDCFSYWFIPAHSTSAQRIYGTGYWVYTAAIFVMYAYVLQDTLRRLPLLSGAKRLELQVWLLGGVAMAATILSLMVLNSIFHDPRLVRPQPLVVLFFYGGTVFAITTYRIFDARQVFLVVVEKVTLVATTALLAFILDGYLLSAFLPSPFDLLITTAVCLFFAGSLNSWIDRKFGFFSKSTSARQAAFQAASSELRVENLENSFLSIMRGWGQTDHALIYSAPVESSLPNFPKPIEDKSLLVSLQKVRWITPERLLRERETTERLKLINFLEQNRLGVAVVADGQVLPVIVGVGIPASRRPFTYPQVLQLQELASIIQGAFERSHFSAKVQHSERLATVGVLGASVAHEIRNPLVSIKTFVQHLPNHYHDAAFRDKFFKLIGEEVSRIDGLTQQLLDLASPRVYSPVSLSLHELLQTTLDLVAPKAADKGVSIVKQFSALSDEVFTDGPAAKQVALNLCFNAIQAVEAMDGEKWVKVSTRNLADGVEMSVEDSGPGIAPEMRAKLFVPFNSSKSTGFGLGLAICSDILTALKATISADPTIAKKGANFRVVFPCRAF